MASLLERVGTLISANLNYLVSKALQANSMAVLDQYVRKIEDIADRGAGYGIPGLAIDGNDVIAVYEACAEAVDRARAGMGPTLIECKTYRWRTHFEGEPDTYRPPEEVRAWIAREPIAPYRKTLIEQGVLSEDQAEGIEAAVVTELDAAVEYARTSPLPEPETALADMWA